VRSWTRRPVPAQITIVHILFLIWTVFTAQAKTGFPLEGWC